MWLGSMLTPNPGELIASMAASVVGVSCTALPTCAFKQRVTPCACASSDSAAIRSTADLRESSSPEVPPEPMHTTGMPISAAASKARRRRSSLRADSSMASGCRP